MESQISLRKVKDMERNIQLHNTDDEMEIDIKELFFVLLDRLWIMILAGVVLAGAAGVYTKNMVTPMYESTSVIYILNKDSVVSLSDLQLGTQLTKDYEELITSRPVVEKVIDNLGLEISYGGFLGRLSISNPSDTRFIKITYLDEDPMQAKNVVDEMAKVSKSRVKEIMNTLEPTISEEGHVATAPSSPNTKKNVLMAGLLGAVGAAFIIILIYLLNDTVRSSDDLEKYLGLTTLGLIPIEDDRWNKKKGKKVRRRNK